MKANVHSDLLGQLRQALIEGEFPPETRLPEKLLCERYGISRTPLREAIKALASEGLVTLIPNRGAWTKTITVAETRHLFSVTGALEALAGEECCQNIAAAEVDALRGHHEAMRAAFDAGDLKTYYRLNRLIHESIVHATGNAVLIAIYAQVNARITRIRFVTPMTPAIWATAMQEHEGMMNAIERRDGAVLGAILRSHLTRKCEAIVEGLLAEAAPAAPAGRRTRRRGEG